jgi:transcriptional regulator with XRE-family HTH domain
MVRRARERPNEVVSPWPDGEALEHSGLVAKAFAVELRRAIGDRTVRSVASACGVNHETIRAILDGRVWPDMHTIARLEAGLGIPLWPRFIS